MPKLKRGHLKELHVYLVFKNEDEACHPVISFILGTILRRSMVCYGAYFNAWQLI